MIASPTSPTKFHILKMRDDRKSSIIVLFAVAGFSLGEKFLFITDRKADSAETSPSRKQPRKEIKPVNQGRPKPLAISRPAAPRRPSATGALDPAQNPSPTGLHRRQTYPRPPPDDGPPLPGGTWPGRLPARALPRRTATAGRGGEPPHGCGGEQGRPDGVSVPRPGELRAGGAATHHGGRFAGAQAAGLTVAIENAASRVPSLRSYWRRLAHVTRTARPLPSPGGCAAAFPAPRALGGQRRPFPGATAVARRELALGPDPVSPLSAHADLPPPNCAVACQGRLGDGGPSVDLRVPSFPEETGAGGGGSKQVGRAVRGAFCNIWGFGVGRLFFLDAIRK